MKAFRFRLARVLQLRELQQRNEELKLEQLRLGRRQIEDQHTRLLQSVDEAQRSIKGQAQSSSSELMWLQAFEKRVEKDRQALVEKLAAQDRLIAERTAALVVVKKAVRLLEKLREQRLEEWSAEQEKELEALSQDFATFSTFR